MAESRRVAWSEGLLMGPQHLQQLDSYHEQLLDSRLSAIERHCWGVLQVELDSRALGSGHVQLSRFHGVLPDGVVLHLEPNDAALPPSRPIGDHFPHTQQALEVFLALPRERPGMDNSAEGTARPVRYRKVARKVYDLAADERASEVAFTQPNLSILFGDEARADFVTLKVAEIVRVEAGGLSVCDPYIPPCLRIGASPFLVSGFRRLLAAMVTRRQALAEARRQSSDASIEFNASDVTRFLLLSTVSSYIPVFTHLVDAADSSPRDAYLRLAQLVGQLTTFSTELEPTQVPRFEYGDLRSTFEALFAQATALLHSTVAEHVVSVRLQGRDDGMHTGKLEDARFLQCDRYFIAVKTDLPESQVASQLPQLSKIASWTDINNIQSAATPGAPCEVTYRPPPEIPVKAGTVYFAIATENAYWRNIQSERSLAVYLPPFFEPSRTQVDLLGVPRRAPAPRPAR